jgi:O-antigen/teichoic acid export membrane protein
MSMAGLRDGVISEIKRIPLRGIKNFSYLTAGNFAAEFLNIVGFVFIARLLGAKDYGVYVTVSTFVGMFDLVLLEGLNKSVMREGTKDLEKMPLQLEKTIGIRNALIAAAILLCWGSSLFAPYDRSTKLYILLFSFQLVYLGLKGFLATIFQATEDMKYIPLFGIVNRILFVGLSITALSLGFGLLALFLISLFANLITLGLNFRLSRKLLRFRLLSRIQVDKKILMPGLVFSLMGFASYLVTRVDLLMVSFLGTSGDVGTYGVAFRIAEQGVVLKNLIVVAFFPIFIKYFHRENAQVRGKRLMSLSGLFFIGVFLATFLLSLVIKDLVSLVFGPQYQASGYILKVLLFYLAFAWSSLPFTTAAQATHNEKYLLMISSGLAVLNVLLNYVFFLRFGLIGIAYSTLVVQFLGCLLESVICYSVLKRQGYVV